MRSSATSRHVRETAFPPELLSRESPERRLQDIAEHEALGNATRLRDPTVTVELAQKISAAQAQEG
jgi:hypothetical protein